MKYQIKYIHITSGRGPVECAWVVAQVAKVILKYCEATGINTSVEIRSPGPENGTFNSILIKTSGEHLSKRLERWRGTIQWIGQSRYRKFCKRKNWFVSVEVINEKEDQQFNLSDIEYQTYKASGPGGQHRNKVETAVRAIHRPSGIIVSASDSRSQHQNKQNAIRRIKEKVQEFTFQKELDQITNRWQQHTSLERGNAVMVFEGVKFKERK